MSSSRRLHLNLFIYPAGHHEAGWRHPDSEPERVLDITYYQWLAQRAEAAKFDSLFFADGPSLASNVRYAARFRLEPFTWLSALAVATERIGLIGTASTTYNQPYNLARLFASLDHLSNGRAGWNIVTTGAPDAAQNFGLEEHPVHAVRYARAHEFIEVVTKLWDSWED
ncbi:MAG TPA: LLM class flavin-dependent oxidoreductase, partial [Actinopolymorphaceae bacterium]